MGKEINRIRSNRLYSENDVFDEIQDVRDYLAEIIFAVALFTKEKRFLKRNYQEK